VSSLVYLYAVLEADGNELRRLAEHPPIGLEREPVETIVEDDLVAAIGRVPEAAYDEEPLNERIRDLEWLGPRAVAHQQVNAALLECTEALVPLAFGAVFRTADRVRAFLREHSAELQTRLSRVRRRAEWVVTIHRDEHAVIAAVEASSPALAALRQQAEGSSPGRGYLLKRRFEEVRRQELFRSDAEALREALDGLAPPAEEIYREPLAQVVTAEGPIARASLLAPRSAEPELATRLDEIRRQWSARGYEVAATGPWPPYRFGGLTKGGSDGE
jgi:hypothetical protein